MKQMYKVTFSNIIDDISGKYIYKINLWGLEKREFATLKRVMKDWLEDKKCCADVTIYREAKLCINLYGLYYLKNHWEPSENAVWFRNNVLGGGNHITKSSGFSTNVSKMNSTIMGPSSSVKFESNLVFLLVKDSTRTRSLRSSENA